MFTAPGIPKMWNQPPFVETWPCCSAQNDTTTLNAHDLPTKLHTPYPGVLGTIRSPQPKDSVDTVDSEVCRVLKEIGRAHV